MSDYHYTKDGRFDMRYASSKEAFKAGLCDEKGNKLSPSMMQTPTPAPVTVKSETGSKSPQAAKSPKEINRTDLGRTKYGSKEDGTNAGHIMSFRVMNAVLRHTPGRPYSEEAVKQIVRELNSDSNLRIKTRSGNMYGYDGYSGDEYYDQEIEKVLDGRKDHLTNQRCVDRLKRQWESILLTNLDRNIKENIRACFCQIKDQNGHVIIRANASLD